MSEDAKKVLAGVLLAVVGLVVVVVVLAVALAITAFICYMGVLGYEHYVNGHTLYACLSWGVALLLILAYLQDIVRQGVKRGVRAAAAQAEET